MADYPTIEVVIRDGNPCYQVCGNGLCCHHRQAWQAIVMFEAQCVANGLPIPGGWTGRPSGMATVGPPPTPDPGV